MRNIVIDCKAITNKNTLYDILKKKLQLPDYFGRNLDALWECIADKDINLPVKIELKNSNHIKEILGDDFYNNLISVFKDAQEELGINIFQIELK